MAPKGFFVTGTDTDVGKTWSAASLMRMLREEGWVVAGMKPVGSGLMDGAKLHGDALALQAEASVRLPDEWVNPYRFGPPVSPHLAAEDAGVCISLAIILEAFRRLAEASACVVVEGAGGWLVPLGPGIDLADLAEALELPVILVVGLRLGCINQARLSARAIRGSKVRFAGWVANTIDPGYEPFDRTIGTLTQHLGGEPLAILSHSASKVHSSKCWKRDEILRRLRA